MFEDILVHDNGKALFYENSLTKSLSRNNVGITCYLAELKDTKQREYVLIKDGEYVFADTNFESCAVRVDMHEVAERGKTRWAI